VIRRRGGALTAVVLAAVAWSPRAGAAPDASGHSLRVVLFAVTGDDPLAGRLDAELRAMGFEVSRAPITPQIAIEELVSRALAAGAQAAVVADGHRTDVWIAGGGSGRVALRQELEVDENAGLQSVLALRTVELLRVSMGLAGPPVEPLPPSSSSSSSLSSPSISVSAREGSGPTRQGRWLAVDASSGLLASRGGVGAFVVAGGRLRARVWGPIGVELCAYAPLSTATQASGPDQARTSIWLAGGGLLLAPQTGRRVQVEAAAGTLGVVVRSTGLAGGSGPGETAQGVGAALYGRAGVRLRLAPRWALRIDLIGGAAVRRPVIVFPDGDTATWGSAFAAGVGGPELRF
jgi:hypothetical protein